MRVLVIGLGSMGSRRVRNLLHIGGCELAAVEPQAQRREQLAIEHQLPVFANFEDGMAWQPDALVISTPPDRHLELALAAARAGLHFFIEASVIPGEAPGLIAAVGTQPIIAAPSCTLRFAPGVQTLRRRIEANAVGRPLALIHHVGQHLADWHPWEDYRQFYVARRRTGAAREIVPFELNWMTYLFGSITRVSGYCGKLSEIDADIDDLYAVQVQFETGVQGSLVVEVISRPAIRQARVIGERGTLVWDFGARCVREWTGDGGWQEHHDPSPISGPGGEWVAENMYIEEMAAFLRAIREGPEHYPFSLEEDHLLLEALFEIEMSSDRWTSEGSL